MPKIEFICDPALVDRIPHPDRASKFIPDWFRSLPREMGMDDAHGMPGLSARACLPMADAMGLGAIIPLPFSVESFIHPDTGGINFRWGEDVPFQPIETHHPAQLGDGGPPFHGIVPLKWINPWRIILPDGYSAQIVQPMNQPQLPFVTFAGAVDCDALDVPVNIPFLWTAGDAEMIIPAGTPIAQVIAYKRTDQIRDITARGASVDELNIEKTAKNRKYSEESVYSREWRHRHKDG